MDIKIKCPNCKNDTFFIPENIESVNLLIKLKNEESVNIQNQMPLQFYNCIDCGYVMLFKKK